MNLIKAGNKDKFLQICAEYVTATRKDPYLSGSYFAGIVDCDLLWENKMLEDKEYCDIKEEQNGEQVDLCQLLLSEDEISACANKINVQEVNLNDLKSERCKMEMVLRKARSKADCMATDDILARLLCLDLFDNNLCQEVKEAADNLQFKVLIDKYQLKDCCF